MKPQNKTNQPKKKPNPHKMQTNKHPHNSQVTVTCLKEEMTAFRGMSIKSNIDWVPSSQIYVLDG